VWISSSAAVSTYENVYDFFSQNSFVSCSLPTEQHPHIDPWLPPVLLTAQCNRDWIQYLTLPQPQHIQAADPDNLLPDFPLQKDPTQQIPHSFLLNDADFFAYCDSRHAHFEEITFHFVHRF
jgi:hypothetical protein